MKNYYIHEQKPKLNLDRFFMIVFFIGMGILAVYSFLISCKLIPTFIDFVFGVVRSSNF